MQQTIEHRIQMAANKYRQARKAYISLEGEDSEAGKQLRELKKEDVAGLGERALKERDRREVEARVGWLAQRQGEGEIVEESEVQNAGSGEAEVTSGESKRHISWLWYQGGMQTEDNVLSREMNDGTYIRVSQRYVNCY